MILSVKTCRRTIQTIASCTAAAGETMPLYPDISWECNLNSKSMNDVNRKEGERREGGGEEERNQEDGERTEPRIYFHFRPSMN